MLNRFTGNPLPPGWCEIPHGGYHGVWVNQKKQMKVIASFEIHDQKQWLHVSISHERRMPAYQDLVYLKRHWIGADKKAVMVLPEESEHVNIHPRCLHLFCCINGDPLPDFKWSI
jgi:hypothetical protein